MTEPEPITCYNCQSQLVEFALDELPEQTRARIAKHLANGCDDCNEQLSEIVNGFAKLAYSLPAERPAARVESELFERIGARNRPVKALRTSEAQEVPIHERASTHWLAAAAVALAASIIGVGVWSSWSVDRRPGTAGDDDWATVQQRVARVNAAERFAAVPQLKFASLHNSEAEAVSTVEGYVIVDRLAKQWHVYAFHLPALASGRQYQLWFDLGDSRYVRAGAAEIDDEGTLARAIDVPEEIVNPKGLAISDEGEAAPERPTGDNFVEAPLR